MEKVQRPLTSDEAHAALTAKGALFEMEAATVAGQALRVWKNAPATLRDVFEGTRQFANRDFLVYEGERLTFDAHFKRTCALGHALVDEFGVCKGDRVAIAMRNYPEAVVAFWAAAIAGAVVVPVNAWWTQDELAYALDDSAARVLIADGERGERLGAYLDASPDLRCVVARSAIETRYPRFEQVVEHFSQYDGLPKIRGGALVPDDNATIFYTSGTTGRPKGALGTHRNICNNILSTAFGRMRSLLRRGEPLSDPSVPQPQKCTLLSVPLFHATGCHAIMVTSAFSGSKLVLTRRWDVEQALQLIEAERVNAFGGVPAIAWQVLEHPRLSEFDVSSVESIGYGGAPAAPELVRRIEVTFPKVSPGNGWGLTETSSVTTQNSGIDYVANPDSVGLPVPVCDVVVGEHPNHPAPSNTEGELWVRGPNVVKGYWQKPDATAETFVDGWLRTGDIGRIDGDGFVYILDRAKDMLIRGGENIYCVEVENALFEHPRVMDAAVVGIPHRILGEEVGAVVQLTPGAVLSDAELRTFVAERIAHFKVPVQIAFQSDPLPRNANGKILKQPLRDAFSADATP